MKKIELPEIYAIANIDDLDNPIDYVLELFNSDIQLLQIRSKKLSNNTLYELTKEIVEISKNYKPKPKIIINDYFLFCKDLDIDGVHLGQEDTNPLEVRKTIGEDKIIGLSTHNIQQVQLAPFEVLNYLAIGPVYLSPTKQGHAEIVGINNLKQIVEISPLEIVAIGGIDKNNLSEVFNTGCQSVALISALFKEKNKKDLVSFAKALRKQKK